MTDKKSKTIRYTVDEWEKVQPALRSLSVVTIDTASKVLVDGRGAPDVAREIGSSRQTVHTAVKRVRARLEKYDNAELVPVLVWVPKDVVESIKEHACDQGGTIEG